MNTRKIFKSFFLNILTDILELTKDSDVHKALLANYNSTLPNLMMTYIEDIIHLKFQTSDGKSSTLRRSHQASLQALLVFVHHNISEGIIDYT